MPRINIEDSIHTDRRFFDLVIKLKDVDRAYGALVRTWLLGQKWYTTTEKMIPLDEWRKQDIPTEVIETGWVEQVGDFIRVCGADKQFAWLAQRVEAGRKGGLSKRGKKLPIEETARRQAARLVLNKEVKSGRVSRPASCSDCGLVCLVQGHHNDYSKPLDVEWLCDSCHDNAHKLIEANISSTPLEPAKRPLADAKPPSLTLSPTQQLNTEIQIHAHPASAVRACHFDFEKIYAKYPRKLGKGNGIKRCKTHIKTEKDYQALLTAVERFNAFHKAKNTSPEYLPYFSTFMSSWQDWLEINPEELAREKISFAESAEERNKREQLEQMDREIREHAEKYGLRL